MKTKTRHALLAASAALFVIAAHPTLAETDVAGVTAAVNPSATAIDRAGRPRLISLGDPVIRNHRIETSGEGLVQILLADGTSFTVGPNSSVVIDSFVYDPEKNTASLAATMTKGALRFIGGKASKASGDVKIDTPIGTAGIRGAVVDINLSGQTSDGQSLPPHMTLVYGKEVQLTGNGAPQRLFRQGFSIVAGDGQPRVQRTPPQWVSGLQQVLAGRPGQSGGSSNPPTEQTVENSTVAQSNSAQLPSENAIPVPQPRPVVATPVEEVAGESQRDVGARPQPSPGQTQPAPVQQPASVPTQPNPGAQPNPDPSPNPDPDPEPEETWDGSAQASAFVDIDGDLRFRRIVGNLALDGDGNFADTFGRLGAVSLEKPDATDTLTRSDVTGTIGSLGAVSGKAYTGSSDFIAYFLRPDDGGNPVYIVGGKAADAEAAFSTSQVYRYAVQRDPINGSATIDGITVPFASSFSSGESAPVRASASDIYAGGVSADSVVARLLQGAISISGTGANQRSRIQVMAGSFKETDSGYQMTGRVSGTFQNSDPNSISTSSTARYVETLGNGSGKDELFGTNGAYLVLASGEIDDVEDQAQMYSTVQVAGRNDSVTTSASRTFGGQTMTGFSSGAANRSNGITELFTGTTSFTFNNTAGTFTGSIFKPQSSYFADFLSSSQNSEQVYLTDQLIAAVDRSGEAYMVSSAVVEARSDNGNAATTICNACEFMTWGWWGKQRGPESLYRVHLGNWIIGKQPENSALPISGTATYNGNAVGTVLNDGAQYIATGTLTSTMDFAARSGTVSVSSYDSKDFGAAVHFGTGTATFSGDITSGVASGSVTGAFASNGTDPVKGIMGSFTANDGGWSSTGIFAGSTTGVAQ
ncbi:MAG: FecR domain-containing protein [Rhizobium sp.]|nr:FecR domain-containing protein [Rhizobium sp.]